MPAVELVHEQPYIFDSAVRKLRLAAVGGFSRRHERLGDDNRLVALFRRDFVEEDIVEQSVEFVYGALGNFSVVEPERGGEGQIKILG